MIDYLIKSAIAMLLLLAVYHLFLEREKMHTFNRFYLLFALVFSLALPFITFTIYKQVPAEPQPVFHEGINFTAPVTAVAAAPVDYTTPALWALYALITLVLAVKFVKNIRYFIKQARKNQSQKLENATLILLEEKVIPHTFLNYIFVSKDDYNHNSIEQELYTHELAHVKQKHSIDILFIEVLKTVLWFNPLLYFYKKAIQLNHEFLADETVVKHSNNVITYQQLLLQKAVPATVYQLASSLNFSVTKKRFKMMTKATPKRKALLLKLAALPVIAGLVYALCTEVVAQTTVADEIGVKAIVVEMPNNNGKADPERDRYYAGVKVVVLNEKRERLIDKPYEELTEAEKDKYLNPIPKPTKKKQISVKEYEALKDKKTFAVWIDENLVDNKELNNFNPKDFAFYFGSPVYKNARRKKFPQPFQYTLYTHKYFDNNLKDSYKKFGSDTYTVVTGNYVKTDEVQPAKVQPKDTNKEYYKDIEKKAGEVITAYTDTVKKNREQRITEAQARRSAAMGERAKVIQKREEMLALRNKLAATRDSVKGDTAKLKKRREAMEAMRAYREQQRQEIMERRGLAKEPAVYQEGKLYAANEVTVQPQYPGGLGAFNTDVTTEIKVPDDFKEKQAKIYVSFIIEKDGNISTVKILRQPDGVNVTKAITEALTKTKKWTPATLQNKAVRCSYVVPIHIEDKK